MVFKNIKFGVVLIFVLIMGVFALSHNGATETNLLKTIMPVSVSNNSEIIEVSEKLSSVIKVVYESDNEDDLERLKTNFESGLKNCEVITFDFSTLGKIYSTHPSDFLSDEDRKLISDNKYDDIKHNAIEELYSPVGVPLVDFDKDPFFFLADFVKSLKVNTSASPDISGQSYDYGLIKQNDGSDIKDIVKLQKKLSKGGNKVYLAGSPVHTYYTQHDAVISINVICTLAVLLILALTYFYYRDMKVVLPMGLSICFGFLAGYCATKLLFSTFHIITLVFSTTLIGIGIDYSYHYLFNSNHNKQFIKNLTNSMFTTVLSFSLLCFSDFELLKQISVFTSVGLVSIYLFVIFVYPCFEFPQSEKTISFTVTDKYKKYIWGLIGVVVLAGGLRLHFNDSLTALYKPTKNLVKSETIYNRLSGAVPKNKVILVKGDNFEQIAQREEQIGNLLYANDIRYISGSKFIPSEKRQKENAGIISKFYSIHNDNFDGILTVKPVAKYTEINTTYKDIPYLKNFMLDDNTSVIYAYADNLPEFNFDFAKIIDVEGVCGKYLKQYRHIILKLLPFIWGFVLILLFVLYGVKKGCRMFVPPFVSSVFALCFASLFGQAVTLFSLLSTILILGFTIDYSIFRSDGERKSEDGIFISCMTTAFSFFALSFTTFKFISSLSFILFVGIVTSYILGKMLFSEDREHI